MRAIVKVGISSWTEKTLIEAGWYPRGVSSAEARLRYYASRFPIVEVDSPYYALPTETQAHAWASRTPDGFTMNVKAYAPFTFHYTDPRRLPKDLFAELPAGLRSKRRVYPRDLGVDLMRELVRRFRSALEPLRAAGKMGVLLVQYPVWFPASPACRAHVERLSELFPDERVAVEFRNRTWMSARNRDRTLGLLAELGFVYTCVDEPQGFVSSVPPMAAATSDVALVRFHGRNVRTWEGDMPSAAARMQYRYSASELQEWVPRLERLARRAGEVHVIMNNCHRDDAVTNATDMASLVGAAGFAEVRPAVPVSAPPLLAWS